MSTMMQAIGNSMPVFLFLKGVCSEMFLIKKSFLFTRECRKNTSAFVNTEVASIIGGINSFRV